MNLDRLLKEAVLLGILPVIKQLAEAGANARTDNEWALRWSANNGNLETIKYLVSIGCDPRASSCGHLNWAMSCALRFASERGHLDIVKYLVSIGVDVRADHDIALRCASEYDHLETIKYLVNSGCDPRSNNNQSVHQAAERGHTAVVDYLKSEIKKQTLAR